MKFSLGDSKLTLSVHNPDAGQAIDELDHQQQVERGVVDDDDFHGRLSGCMDIGTIAAKRRAGEELYPP